MASGEEFNNKDTWLGTGVLDFVPSLAIPNGLRTCESKGASPCGMNTDWGLGKLEIDTFYGGLAKSLLLSGAQFIYL